MPHQIFRRNQPGRRLYHLSPEQVACWMQYGFIKVPQAFSREAAVHFTRDVWVRLGFDPDDKSTWGREVTHMQSHNCVRVSDFAPRAWRAICELVGGEDRISEYSGWWDDTFIVNLGSAETEGIDSNVVDEVSGWHVDGDFFVHFLDSPEQALLVVPCWGDIIENGGGTVICTDGIAKVAQWLYEHPEGVHADLKPLNQAPAAPERYYYSEFADQCESFFELTGEAGDVFILHPLMIHSAAKNGLRIPRFITNPNVMLKEPFDFDRDNRDEYSLVELKTLKDLGKDRLTGWQITGERQTVTTEREEESKHKLEEEKGRLEAAKRAQRYREQVSLDSRPPPIPPRPFIAAYPRTSYA